MQAPMFKAPAVAFGAAATDFLLVRHPTGRLTLREFQGAVAVGQQEPHLRVPVPNTKDKRCALISFQTKESYRSKSA